MGPAVVHSQAPPYTARMADFDFQNLKLISEAQAQKPDDGKKKNRRSGFWPFTLENLDQISPGLALMEADSFYMENIYCASRKIFSPDETKSTLPSEEHQASDSILGKIRTKEKAICTVSSKTSEDTKKIAAETLQDKTVSPVGYLFFAFDSDPGFYEEEETYSGRPLKQGRSGLPVGLFHTLQDCQNYEEILRRVDFSTGFCKPWKETWLGKLRTSFLMEIKKERDNVDYEDLFWKIFSKIFIAVVIFWIYYVAKLFFSSTLHEKIGNYSKGLGAAFVIAIISWSSYGTHKEDADPLYGGGYTVVDFVPTKKERNEHGLFVFFITLIPIWYGTYKVHSGETVERDI